MTVIKYIEKKYIYESDNNRYYYGICVKYHLNISGLLQGSCRITQL